MQAIKIQARQELIQEIKEKVSKILENKDGNDMMFDIVFLLKGLK